MTTVTIEAIQKLARLRWDEREAAFPPRVRLKWEDGSFLARLTALENASMELMPIEKASVPNPEAFLFPIG